MLPLTPQSRIFVATEPVDFRQGIDGRAAVCRQRLGETPLAGAVDGFRNRSGTSRNLLLYDGQGSWMGMKRLSTGRFSWWPHSADARVPLSARELVILLGNGPPARAQLAQDWRRVAWGEARLGQ
jgi:transposase